MSGAVIFISRGVRVRFVGVFRGADSHFWRKNNRRRTGLVEAMPLGVLVLVLNGSSLVILTRQGDWKLEMKEEVWLDLLGRRQVRG